MMEHVLVTFSSFLVGFEVFHFLELICFIDLRICWVFDLYLSNAATL